jgi:hypothetical protein
MAQLHVLNDCLDICIYTESHAIVSTCVHCCVYNSYCHFSSSHLINQWNCRKEWGGLKRGWSCLPFGVDVDEKKWIRFSLFVGMEMIISTGKLKNLMKRIIIE